MPLRIGRDELVTKLRSWAQRHPVRSMERRLMHAAADELEKEERAENYLGSVADEGLTVERIEEAIGGKLMPWQKKNLER